MYSAEAIGLFSLKKKRQFKMKYGRIIFKEKIMKN